MFVPIVSLLALLLCLREGISVAHADELQPYPEYGFIRQEFQAQYFSVVLTAGQDYTFTVSRTNVSQKPVNVNGSVQQLGEPFLQVFRPDGSVAVVRQQIQASANGDCYWTDSSPGCLPYTLTATQTGAYKLRVNGYLNDFGGFSLAVTNSGSQLLEVTPFERVPEIQNLTSQELPGFDPNATLWRIKNEAYLTRAENTDVWTFTAKQGDFVQIQLDIIAPFPKDGDGDERQDLAAGKLFLFDQNYNLISSDEGFVPFGNARILSTLPSSGTYYIAVTPLGEYDDDYCIVSCSDFWGDDRLHSRVVQTDANGEPVVSQGPIISDGIANYELDTEIKILPYQSDAIANEKPKAVKVNAIIITNDITLACDCWTDRDGNNELPLPSEAEIKDYLAAASTEFFELYSGEHWDGFELARISRFYSPEYVGTKRTDSILYDFSNLPVALEGHINIVFARLSDYVNVTGSTFLNGTLASKHGATLVVDAYKSPQAVLIHELGHVLGIKHVAGTWPPAVMDLELADSSLIGYTGLDHSNPEQSYMSTWIPYANEPGYENKSRFLTEQSFTLNTPTYGRLFAQALRDWLERNDIIGSDAPQLASSAIGLDRDSGVALTPGGQRSARGSKKIWGSVTDGPDSGQDHWEHGIFPSIGLASLANGASVSAAIWEDDNWGSPSPRVAFKSGNAWGATRTFSTASGNPVGAHQIEVDGAGNAIALWEPSSGKGIEVVAHAYDGVAWMGPETISLSSTGDNYRADLVMNESGVAAAVWLSRIDANSGNLPPSVMFGQKNISGSWSTAISLVEGNTTIEDPSVAINEDGDILVTWQQLNNGVFAIKGRYLDAETQIWSAVETYSDASQNLHGGFAEAALDADGNAVITWRRADAVAGETLATKGDLVARYRSSADGALGPITQLSENGHDAFNRSVEVDRKTVAFLPDNSAVTAWYAFDGTDFRVYAAEMDAQQNWGAAVPLSAPGQHAKLPSLGVDGRENGSVGVAWVRSNGIHQVVQFSSKSINNGTWTDATDLSPGTETAFWPMVAMDGAHSEAIWSRFNGTNVSLSSIKSVAEIATYSIGGTVTGLGGSDTLVMQNNGGDNLTVEANGSFVFDTLIDDGSTYSVTVLSAPNGSSCAVSNSSGTATSDVADVGVSCSTDISSQEPAQPVITATEEEDGKITLFVSISYTGDSGLDFFTATCRSGAENVTVTSVSSPITLTGMDETKTYTCSVTATNASGFTSAASQDISGITPVEMPAGLPVWLLYQATQ